MAGKNGAIKLVAGNSNRALAQQIAEYLKTGIAINAVNMPAITPEQYRALTPYVTLAERLGRFASHIATGSPQAVRIGYTGRYKYRFQPDWSQVG